MKHSKAPARAGSKKVPKKSAAAPKVVAAKVTSKVDGMITDAVAKLKSKAKVIPPAPADPVPPAQAAKELNRLKKRLKEIDSPNVHTMPTPAAAPVPVSALPTVPVTEVKPKKEPADRREAAKRAWVTIRAKRAAAAAAAAKA